MDLEQLLRGMARSAVRLETGGGEGAPVGRFGGAPDVPGNFVWPCFETAVYGDDTVKPRPLAFLAQFGCAALAPLDADGLLPREGTLSFFYELGSQRWGFDPKDAGCARVFWFPDSSVLAPAEFPAELDADCRLPPLDLRGRIETAYPDFEDFSLSRPDIAHPSCWAQAPGGWSSFGEQFDKTVLTLRSGSPTGPSHRLLGWPDIIQNNMTLECELVSRGHYLGGAWETVSAEEKQEAARISPDGWRLLFQLDSFSQGGFSLDFGDSGSVYFYIRREDLAARCFDRVWLIQQCC